MTGSHEVRGSIPLGSTRYPAGTRLDSLEAANVQGVPLLDERNGRM